MQIELHTLLDPKADRSVYEVKPEDHTTQAQITVAQLKDLLLAVNASAERIQLLYSDLQAAEKRIESLERTVRNLADYNI